ncbi:MAG: glycosyltransferase [Candidatus Melainabacteria bacterium]
MPTLTNLPDQKQPASPHPAAIRVLHIYQDFGAVGGIETWIRRITQPAAGPSVHHAVACSAGGPLMTALSAQGTPTFGLNTHKLFKTPLLRMLDVSTTLQLLGIIRQVRPDILHVHIGQCENLLGRLLGLPVVYSFHGYGTLYNIGQTPSALKRAYKRLMRPLFQATARGVNALLFVSDTERRRMTEEGYLSAGMPHCRTLHNGVDAEALLAAAGRMPAAALKASLNLPGDARLLTYVNRLDWNKDPLAFLRIAGAADAQLQDPRLHIVIAGDGVLRDEVKKAVADSPLKDRIRLTGYLSDVAPLIAASDLIVHTPHHEGFGLGVLEAMTLGTPVAAYAVDGINEVLSVPTCLVPPQQEAAMARTVCRLLRHSQDERQELASQLMLAAEPFRLSHLREQLNAMYQQLASTHTASP